MKLRRTSRLLSAFFGVLVTQMAAVSVTPPQVAHYQCHLWIIAEHLFPISAAPLIILQTIPH